MGRRWTVPSIRNGRIAKRAAERAEREQADSVIEACERLLSGRVLEGLRASGTAVRPWVVINTLSHANRDGLVEFATQRIGEDDPSDVRRTRSMLKVLSRELLRRADELGVAVEDLQRRVLVPIELRTLSGGLGPATLFRIVRTALDDERCQPAS